MEPYEFFGILAFAMSTIVIIATIILLFPVARRLGGFMEEWIKLRRDQALDHDQLADMRGDVRDMRQLLENVDRRLDVISERQDFVESLIETRDAGRLPEPDFS